MTIRTMKASTPELLARYLNGLVVGKRMINVAGKDVNPSIDPATASAAGDNLFKHPVDGLTLIFTTPVGTVTFSDNLHFKEIMEEIEAEIPGIGHLFKIDPNGGSVLAFWDDTTPVVMGEDGTANAYFGFPTDAAHPGLTQTVTDPADILSIHPDTLSKQWVAFIDD